MDKISTQVFHIKHLPTASVTLYPSRAHVVRDIANVELQPGQNEVELYGLSPTVDENSIQIEGHGSSATITDITVDLVPNRDDFLETFPEDSDSEVSDSEEYEDSDDEIDSVRTISNQIKTTDRDIERQLEEQRSAQRQLQTLDQHSKSINAAKFAPDHLIQMLRVYQEQRQRLFDGSTKATDALQKLQKQKKRLEATREKAGQDERKRSKETEKEKKKLKTKQLRLKQERQTEAARVKSERMKFWPHKVYRVVVHIETTLDTPQTTRRNSFDSVTLANAAPEALDKGSSADKLKPLNMTVALSLSYVTTSAYWSPRYDLSLSSVQKTATIVYRAEFRNGTSETWKDAKVILSTSQTSYSGLEDKAPTMQAWNVKLGRTFDGSNGLLSNDETPAVKLHTALVQKSKKAQLLGGPTEMPAQNRSTVQATGGLFAAAPISAPGAQPVPSMLHARSQRMPQFMQQQQQQTQVFGHVPTVTPEHNWAGANNYDRGLPLPELTASEDPDLDNLDSGESSWEDYGLTATYDVPGKRTLAPSSLLRRHKIATFNATSIIFSHMAVPKLRAAAFLRARVKNPSSSVTLLKGTAGVTLDSSFLGNTTLQRISPGQTFTLPLGVDPAIHVSYSKPTVHRSTQGIFNKESAHSFNRSILLTNTKSTAIDLLVLDQVPVSQEERLKIDILQPRGLGKEGDVVKTGQSAKVGAADWGKAQAVLKKNGEIAWTVDLKKGHACLLKLDYDARLPSNEAIVTA